MKGDDDKADDEEEPEKLRRIDPIQEEEGRIEEHADIDGELGPPPKVVFFVKSFFEGLFFVIHLFLSLWPRRHSPGEDLRR